MNQDLCKDVRLLLPLYIENMLSDEEMTQVRDHLAECSGCQSEYDLLKGIMQATKEMPSLEVSDEFTAKLHERLEETAKDMVFPVKRVRANRLRNWRIYPIIAAGAAVVALSVFALNRIPDTSQFVPNQPVVSPVPGNNLSQAIDGLESAEDSAAPGTGDFGAVSASTKPEQENRQTASPALDDENGQDNLSQDPITEPAENLPENAMALSSDSEAKNSIAPPASPGAETSATSLPPVMSAATSSFTEEEKENFSQNDSANDKAGNGESASDAKRASGASAASAGTSGGGGSSSGLLYSAAKAPDKQKITVSFYFTQEGLALARGELSGMQAEDGSYRVPSEEYSSYADLLQNTEGYLYSDTHTTDYSEEYADALKKQAEGVQAEEAEDTIEQIDQYASYYYIELMESE